MLETVAERGSYASEESGESSWEEEEKWAGFSVCVWPLLVEPRRRRPRRAG